jgi:sec-independent protein translocase protein TatC
VSKDKSMSLIDHLEELRRRIFVSIIAILVATTVAFFFSDALLKVILLPSGGLQLNAFSLMALAGSTILFVLGAAFGFYLLGGMIHVLVELLPSQVQFLPSADDYINFVAFFLLACGLAFQLPTLLLILVQLRLLSSATLRRQRRIAYFALFAFAEIITPVADPIIAPLTIMVPLVILYEISIFFAGRIEKRRKPEPSTELVAS